MYIQSILSVLAMTLLLTGCKDKMSSPLDGKTNITPISPNECDNDINYSGINSVTEITDTTVKISWSADSAGIGFSIFKSTGSGLERVGNLSAGESEFTLGGLVEETDYDFIVRTISKEGFFDCNENMKTIRTTEKQTFISCSEIHSYYSGVKPSGIYEIDTDLTGTKAPINVYCDMDNNSGGWTKVFAHNTAGGFFANDAEAIETNIGDHTSDKYSILSRLDDFRRSGKLEFWLHYPQHDGIDGGNIWTQLSNPVTSAISGYVSIREDYTGMYWGGLEKSSAGTLMDGSVSSSWWFYAIGSHTRWPSGNTIPGPMRNTGVNEVQLFVK